MRELQHFDQQPIHIKHNGGPTNVTAFLLAVDVLGAALERVVLRAVAVTAALAVLWVAWQARPWRPVRGQDP